MADPESVEEQDKAEDRLFKIAIGIEVAVMAVMAQRLLRIGDGEGITASYVGMTQDLAQVDRIIRDGSRELQSAAEQIMERMAANNDKWANAYYMHRGIRQKVFRDVPALRQAYENGVRDALSDIKATCRTSVIGIKDKKVTYPLKDEYKALIDQVSTAMAAGEATYTEAFREATATLANSGLKVEYASGHTRELYSAVRMNVMDAYRSTMVEMRTLQGLEFGADGYRVSAHMPCAPDHIDYQGGVYTFAKFDKVQDEIMNDSGRPLVTGANCGHTVSPVIVELAQTTYSKAKLAEMKRLSEEKVTFEGMSGKQMAMSRYEASQYQRNVETSIRRDNIEVYLAGDMANPATIAAAKEKARYYSRMSKAVGLPAKKERFDIF